MAKRNKQEWEHEIKFLNKYKITRAQRREAQRQQHVQYVQQQQQL